MVSQEWKAGEPAADQLRRLVARGRRAGLLAVRFRGDACPQESLRPEDLEPWTRSRAVTVADVGGEVAGAALEVALCADLVVLRTGARLRLPPDDQPPPPGVVWAARRAGRRALWRCLLGVGAIAAEEAMELGLAQWLVPPDADLPPPDDVSLAALTAARDLLRCRSGRGAALQLESATFRLLFATGAPQEGARAFLEKREPRFEV